MLTSFFASLLHVARLATALLLGVAGAALAQTPNTPLIKIALIESLSGPFANTGEAVFRNLLWATERVNARGGVKLPGYARALAPTCCDIQGQNEEALCALRAVIDDGVNIISQSNSSATAAVLVDAINKNNERELSRRVLFLNYSAVDPTLTNEKCSFSHFRFDAHADMRLAALMEVLGPNKSVTSVSLMGQDYSFGQAVAREGRRQINAQPPHQHRRGRAAPAKLRQGLHALRGQDQVQRRAGRADGQLGQ